MLHIDVHVLCGYTTYFVDMKTCKWLYNFVPDKLVSVLRYFIIIKIFSNIYVYVAFIRYSVKHLNWMNVLVKKKMWKKNKKKIKKQKDEK